MDGAAVAVAEDLDLDVAGLGEVLLEVERVVAESGRRFTAGGSDRARQFARSAHDLHAAAAAAGRRLDQHRVADVAGDAGGGLLVADGAVGARHHRDAEAGDGALGLDLVAHHADVLGARPDEGDLVGGEDLGETGVFGKEAVAGVDGLGAGDLAGGKQAAGC